MWTLFVREGWRRFVKNALVESFLERCSKARIFAVRANRTRGGRDNKKGHVRLHLAFSNGLNYFFNLLFASFFQSNGLADAIA